MWLATAQLMHRAHKPSTFLLRDDVERVLSADTLVWPSLLENRPEWIGANDPFWDNPVRLEPAVSAARETHPHRIIAATWHEEEGGAEHALGPYAEPAEPDVRNPGWPLLGFDVTDGFPSTPRFTSSVCGWCGRTRRPRRVTR